MKLSSEHAAAVHFAALVASSDDAIISKDLDGYITSWNTAAERIFGYTPGEMIGRSIRTLIPDDRQPEEDDVLARVRRGERVLHFETVRRHKDGSQIAISLTVSPIRDSDGRIIGASKIARDIRSRLEAEARLYRAQTFANRVANTSPDILFVYDVVDRRIVFINDRIRDVFGYTEERWRAMAGDQLEQLVPAEDRQALTDALGRLAGVRDDDVIEYYHRLRRADGVLRDVRVRASVFERTAAGLATQIIGHCVDITDAKVIESSERDLRRRLELLAAAAATVLTIPSLEAVLPATLTIAGRLIRADGYAVWRLDAATRRWRIAASTGMSQQFVAETIALQPDSAAAGVPFTEPIFMADVAAQDLVGSRRDLYVREGIRSMLVAPLVIADVSSGTLVFYYRAPHTATDVDLKVATAIANLASGAIRAAELYEELQRRAGTSQFLAEAGEILGSSLDYDDTLKRVVDLAVPKVADWCAVDILRDGGRVERLAVAHADPTKMELARSLEARYPSDPESPYGVHQVIRTKTAVMMSHIPEDLIVASARDDEHLRVLRELGLSSYMCVPLLARGRVLGVLTLVAAESRRRYSAVDLQFAQELSARAALAIENAHAYEEARRANALKDEFLATLSHELRTPLNAVLGYTRMLRTGLVVAERQDRALDVVERNAVSLAQLVEDVLDVSRIITGKIRLHVRSVDLTSVLQNAVASVLPGADAKGVRLQTIVDQLAPPISGDPERLQQVIWNLLANAVKFTPRDGRVQLRLERVNSHVEIVVSDTGLGIKPEFLPHLFERFTQADSGFSREHGGLGLGLAITRHIVEMHGGTIHAASAGEGQGATFRVALPIMISHAAPESEEPRAHPRVALAESVHTLGSLAGICVLAVDDEPDALSMITDILEAAGATVLTASSGTEAMMRLREMVPDVLISDIGMPHMDGFELLRQIQQSGDSTLRDLPAAALTAYARSDDRIRALTAGFSMHLAKPIQPAELVAAVRRLAARRHPDASTAFNQSG